VVLFNLTGLGPMSYDARVLPKDAKVIKVRSTWLISFKVLKEFYHSIPSLTPIS
jgi:hypothetical protein